MPSYDVYPRRRPKIKLPTMKGALEYFAHRALRVTQSSTNPMDMRALVLIKYIRRLERKLEGDPDVIDWRQRLNFNDPLVKGYFG